MGVTQNILFNRFIDFSILNSSGKVLVSVKCPKAGRKPNIEINGTSVSRSIMNGMNLKIKNLYIKKNVNDYAVIKVTLGYAGGKSAQFKAAIQYIYQEAPGPEGSTVIQCLPGTSPEDVLTKTISDIGDTKNKSLYDILNSISTSLGLKEPIVDDAIKNRTVDTPLVFTNLTASQALQKIENAFQQKDEVLFTTYTEDRIRVFLNTSTSSKNGLKKRIDYLNTPPQIISNEEGGTAVATFSAPYDPAISVGDVVSISTNFYKTSSFKASSSGRTDYKVNNIHFQFSTCGNANQMIIQGVRV